MTQITVIRVAAAALVVAGALRIAATYEALNHTMDEPTHIACGLEWIEQRSYRYEPQHPPLARVAVAVGPALLGAPNVPKREELPSRNPIVLYESKSYHQTLSWARAGVLPFFALGCWVVFAWARRLHGDGAGLAALLLFTTLPPVLAHGGLATTDMAVGATVPAALFAWQRWLDGPGARSAAVLGVAVAAAILSKFTALLFLPVCAAVIVAVRWRAVSSVRSISVAAATCLLFVWAGYGFSVSTIAAQPPVRALQGLTVPAAELVNGLAEAADHNQAGHRSYLLGEERDTGWWYFFPVVFFFKTPLAFLLLVAIAAVLLGRDRREAWAPGLCALAILAVVLPARINLGVRHILPMYALLAIPAGFALWKVAQTRRGQIAAVALAGWQVVGSATVHPDYLTYFNEFALGEPEKIRVDSDLDWGQGLERLAAHMRKRNVTEEFGLSWFGSTVPIWHGLNAHKTDPWKPEKGWVAIGATARMLPVDPPPEGEKRKAWWWLEGVQPADRIGGMLLYHIPQ